MGHAVDHGALRRCDLADSREPGLRASVLFGYWPTLINVASTRRGT